MIAEQAIRMLRFIGILHHADRAIPQYGDEARAFEQSLGMVG